MKSLNTYVQERLIINKNYNRPEKEYDPIVNKIINNCDWTQEVVGHGTGQVDVGQEIYTSKDCKAFFDDIISPILNKSKMIGSSTAIRRYNPVKNHFNPILIVHSKGTFSVYLILGADENNELEQYWINVTNKNNIRFEGYFKRNGAYLRSLRSYLERDECYSITNEDFKLISYAFDTIKENAI